MKLQMVLLLAVMLVFSGVVAAHDRDDECDRHHYDNGFLRDSDADWDADDGTLVISNEDDDGETVEITRKYELFVHGEKIDLDRAQKKLVKDYYKHFKKLDIIAEEMGREGAVLGEKAGLIAEAALKNICKLLGDDEDVEKYEEEIEREAEKIEAAAEKLEEKAEVLEEIVEELEDLHYDMKDAIPELDDLEWF